MEIYFSRLKRKGFSDNRLAAVLNVDEQVIRNKRYELDIRPVYKRVDTCAAGVSFNHCLYVFHL